MLRERPGRDARDTIRAGRTGECTPYGQGPRRDCQHDGQPHRHGTRVAYVRDRCRCRECRAANTAASRRRDRQIAYDRWTPWADAAPVRDHIRALAEAGIGRLQLAQLCGVSARHLRALVNGQAGRVQRRVRSQTAEHILAVRPEGANCAPARTVDATGTRRRLQALIALGWPQAWLADLLHRDPGNLRRTVHSKMVTARTAVDVTALYERLWNIRPPAETPRQRRAVSDALALAARHGWPPPLAWDDPDRDDQPPRPDAGGVIDEIAVERAITDRSVRYADLRPDEQAEAVRRLATAGRSISQTAEHLHTSSRTVSRRRRGTAA